MKRELQLTADGSHTLYLPEMDEHYHSVNGAIQESRHVFIEAGLNHHPTQQLNLLEIGFGTGLNALLTLQEATRTQRHIVYYAVEEYPLEQDIIDQLNYGEILSNHFNELHQAAWDQPVRINDYFTLHKILGDSNQIALPQGIDVVYFDAFAPDKQPEMWNQAIFDKLFRCMNAGGILTTYCAKGEVRRSMQKAGYSMERIPGPPGKREMLRATKRLQ